MSEKKKVLTARTERLELRLAPEEVATLEEGMAASRIFSKTAFVIEAICEKTAKALSALNKKKP